MSGVCYCGRCSGCVAAWESGRLDAEQEARERAEDEAEEIDRAEHLSSLVPTSIEDPWAWNHFGPEPGDEP